MRRFIGLVLSAVVGGGLLVTIAAPASAEPVVAEPGAGFQTVDPVRLLDTRTTSSPVGAEGTVTVDLSTRVPATVTAVVLNVTGTQPSADTWITVYPSGAAKPLASNLNLVAGQTRPNLVTVAVGADRKVVLYNQAGTVHLIADMTGYYAPEAPWKFFPLDSTRRAGGQIGHRSTGGVGFAEKAPPSVTAVAVVLTAEKATAGTFLTIWQGGKPMPGTSTLNLVPGDVAQNMAIVPVTSSSQSLNLYNHEGAVEWHVSVVGYYTPDYGARFTPLPPERVLDTRHGTGGVTGPVGSATVTFDLGQNVPADAIGAVLNVTGTQAADTARVYLSPGGSSPFVSGTWVGRGQTAASLAVIGLGDKASISMASSPAATHVVADLAGYFTLPPIDCADGCVYAWGSNFRGNLGSGRYVAWSAEPLPLYGLSGVKAIAGNYALKSDGTVWSWGDNPQGHLGQGWTFDYSTFPRPVVGLTDVVAIDKGIALKSDGTVWAWGRTPPFINYSTPRQVPGITDAVAVSSRGSHAVYALRRDGTVWSWGTNTYGELGLGKPTHFSTDVPMQVVGLTDVKTITSGTWSAYAIKNDGTVWAWGANQLGQLGQGIDRCSLADPDCSVTAPIQVPGVVGPASISADYSHVFAVMPDGSVRAWGDKSRGGLGTGEQCSACSTGTPVTVAGLTKIRAVNAGDSASYAVDTDGRVWSWGYGKNGRLGPVEGTPPPYAYAPMRLSAPTGVSALTGTESGFALVP